MMIRTIIEKLHRMLIYISSEYLIKRDSGKHDLNSVESFYAGLDMESAKNITLDTDGPIICGNLTSHKTLLIVDDQAMMYFLYDLDFGRILTKYGLDILSEYKIVRCCGDGARILAVRYINSHIADIFAVILDITMGPVAMLDDGRVLRYDGVDIAINILSMNPCCRVAICSPHPIDDSTDFGDGVTGRYSDATGMDLKDIAFHKSGDRVTPIYMLLRPDCYDILKIGADIETTF